jgi:hypothetical protein
MTVTNPSTTRRRLLAAAAALFAALGAALAGGAPAGANPYTPAGTIVSDSGFRPQANGYSFENYTNDNNPENLNAESMRKLFGSAVCMGGGGPEGGCQLIPAARAWKEAQNKGMGGGHCEGFAVTASLFYAGLGDPPEPSPFGAGTVPALSLDGNAALQAHIAYGFAFQYLASVSTTKVNASPMEVLGALAAGLPSHEPMVLGVYKRGFVGGHAITPLAIEDRGSGEFAILVYDNNFPNVIREVRVDANANTWNYKASTNPSAEADLYEGDANTKTLEVEYARRGLGAQPCPFCSPDASGNRAGAAREDSGGDGAAQLFWQGDPQDGRHAEISLADGDGNTAGCTGEGDDRDCASDIPGVTLVPSKLGDEGEGVPVWEESAPPVFDLPDDLDFEVHLDGSNMEGSDDEGFSLVRDGVTFDVSDLQIRAGDEQSVSVEGKSLSLENGADHDVDPTIGYGDMTGGDGYRVTVRTDGIDEDGTLDLSSRPGRRSVGLEFDGSGKDDVDITVVVARTDADGEVTRARSRPTTLEGGDDARISYSKKAMRDGKL